VKRLISRTYVRFVALRESERGGSLIEYSLLVAFIALATIFALTQVGEQTLSNAASVLPGLGGTP
jgi:Flp pilus assembly pilin Flp